MTAQTTSALDQLIADMTELVRAQPEQSDPFQRAATYLERLIREPDAIPEDSRRPIGSGARPNHGSYAL
jgi:predicted metal-dependent enzyme (double-stranded beta helix superfamily)